MKLFLHTLAIAALSVCCLQMANAAKQSVFASKKDSSDTREVTVKIIGVDGEQAPISSSTFKKDTSGLRPKKLNFDFGKGYSKEGYGNYNKITASYTDGSGPTFEPFEVRLAPKGSKIKLDQGKIVLTDAKGKPIGQQNTQLVKIKLPENSKKWTLASGTIELTSAIAEGDGDQTKRLKRITVSAASRLSELPIYKDQDTNIYAKILSGGSFQITTLMKSDIEKAGVEAMLQIDEAGKALITSPQQIKQQEQDKLVAQQQQGIIRQNLATKKRELEVQQQALERQKQLTKGLPYEVALKALLLSKTQGDYISKRDGLLNSDGSTNEDSVKSLMNEPIADNLLGTLFAQENLKEDYLRSGHEQRERRVTIMSERYKRIRTSLNTYNPTFWQKAPNKELAKLLFDELLKQ